MPVAFVHSVCVCERTQWELPFAAARCFLSAELLRNRDGRTTFIYPALDTIATDIKRSGAPVMSVTADVTKFSDIEAMRHRIERERGMVDILVANAGASLTPPGPIEETSEEGWHASLHGNLTATFLTLKSFLPGMKQRKAGTIITISSSAARTLHANAPIPYGVAKAGIQLLTRYVAAQVGPFRIRANCIAPDTILTERNQQRIPAEQKLAMIGQHPLQRLGTTEDVANAALFLALCETAWITGTTLDVAGGAVML